MEADLLFGGPLLSTRPEDSQKLQCLLAKTHRRLHEITADGQVHFTSQVEL